MQEKNEAEHLVSGECSADDSHAVLVFQCKPEAKPERLAPYPNSSPHHDLMMNRGTALKSV